MKEKLKRDRLYDILDIGGVSYIYIESSRTQNDFPISILVLTKGKENHELWIISLANKVWLFGSDNFISKKCQCHFENNFICY